AGRAVGRAHVRPAARARHRDHVGPAVAVAVNGCDPHAAGEVNVVGEVAEQDRAVQAVEGGDVRPAAGVGADDDVRGAVAVHVAGRYVGTAGEVDVVSVEVQELPTVRAAVGDDVGAAARAGRADDIRNAVAVHVAHRDAHAARK